MNFDVVIIFVLVIIDDGTGIVESPIVIIKSLEKDSSFLEFY